MARSGGAEQGEKRRDFLSFSWVDFVLGHVWKKYVMFETNQMKQLLSIAVISSRLRLDKGTETGKMATIHAFLRKDHGDCNDPADTVHYGPSTTNKVFGLLYFTQQIYVVAQTTVTVPSFLIKAKSI